ncbi:MAG: SRPBCC domain-containing protein, partial [Armatimonadetes bacterium]|nr:SRPBCC domain-containing protein [Armatimonadota bacterium]
WNKSFATPGALSSWFPERIEGEFVVGKAFTMIWGEDHCECILTEYVEGVAISYQWHPGENGTLNAYPQEELTTVRFSLEAEGDSTLVTMVESGFTNIAESRQAKAFNENNGGWDSEMPKLARSYED